MKRSFVLYNVKGVVKKENTPAFTINVSGVCQRQPEMLSCVFRQNPELRQCNIIEHESYKEILGGKHYGSYQET